MLNKIVDAKTLMPTKRAPLVTIVTPAYNQCEYLEATMRSVLAQDYTALEYIVIDDGSSDQTLNVAQRIADEFPGRVKVLTQTNSGQAATLNNGWAVAKGEILGYISSDDCLLPEAVSQMVEALQAKPNASVVYCDFWIIDENGKRLKCINCEDFDSRRMTIDLVCQPGPGAFFRRKVFENNAGWNIKLRQVPDFDFWLRAIKIGDFIRVPNPLAEYRIHEGSASFCQMTQARAEEIIYVVKAYWEHDKKNKASEIAIARACVIAAKNHAQSGRSVATMKMFIRAVKTHPRLVCEVSVWRQLFSGLLRRLFYQSRIHFISSINSILGFKFSKR